MKRLMIMALLVAFVLGLTAPAQAALVRAKGDWQMSGNYVKNPQLDSDLKDDKFQAVQRIRTTFEFIANENLRAVFRLHIENRWGQENHQVGTSGRGTLGYDQAYLDYFIPNTEINIRAGKQTVVLPNTLGSHILDEEVYGLTASMPFNDTFGLTLGWTRLFDGYDQGLDTNSSGFINSYSKDEVDTFFAILPVTLDGVQLNPFAVYSREGKFARALDGATDMDVTADPATMDNADRYRSRDRYWLGLNMTLDMFDPIVIMADFNYGSSGKYFTGINPGGTPGGDFDFSKHGETAGWIANLAVQYNMDLMKPMAFFLYESGESRSSAYPHTKGKRMPSFVYNGNFMSSLNFSSFGFEGSNFRGNAENALWGLNWPSGKWALGIKLQEISFVDKLSHDFLVAYYQGTNHKSLVNFRDYAGGNDPNSPDDPEIFMTTKDSAWEVNFDTRYQMYENLAVILELGYINADFKKRYGEKFLDDPAWKAAFGFRYMF